ncbi:MAG: PspC domain-containing protein [Calditrichaeota bacterium]|nr:MAG: PspC domain-containing protein [Calditrichota bacterium]
MDKKLMRSSTDRMIGGVCGGLAEYFNIDPSLVRIGFALLTLAGGGFLGIVAYIVMLIVIPEEPVTQTPQPSGKTSEPKSKK